MSLLKVNEVQNYNGSSLTLTASTVSTSAQLNTGGNISVTGSINVSDDSTTRSNLGLGSIATQDSDNVTVTGGTATLGALTVSGSDSGDLVRITQTGSGNALVVEDSTNPDSTPFVVDASGNVGIGTTPTYKLDISSNSTQIRIKDADTAIASGTNTGIRFEGSDGAHGLLGTFGSTDFRIFSAAAVVFATGGLSTSNESMRINSSGDLILAGSTAQKASGTTWTNPSDIRLKENITNYSKGISELNQIQVKQWEYNGKAGTVLGQIGLGVIADDIESVLPNTVDTYSAKLNEDDETETDIKKFDATEITWLLVNTCKEQQTIIESQQSQIDALTARIEALETA